MDIMARMTREEKDEIGRKGLAVLVGNLQVKGLCPSCGKQATVYAYGTFLCREHARAQGIEPSRKQEEMGFGGQSQAVQGPELADDANVIDGPWTATADRAYERISITFKHGSAFDEPWVVFKGDTVDEVSGLIQEFRDQNGFAQVAGIAAEFKGAKSIQDAAVAAVQQSMPGAQVVQQPVAQNQQEPPQQAQSYPPCHKCGAPTDFKRITSRKNGKTYSIYECSTGDRDHTRFLN